MAGGWDDPVAVKDGEGEKLEEIPHESSLLDHRRAMLKWQERQKMD